MKEILVIFLGGGAGSVMRYALQEWMHERITIYHFPWATFSVNIAGSFLIGLLYALSARLAWPAELRLLLTAGLCGGFTTFSTFSNDIVQMMRQGHTPAALLYILLSLLLGVAACYAATLLFSPAPKAP